MWELPRWSRRHEDMYNPGPWQTKPIHQRIRNLDGEEEGDRSTLSLFLKGLVKQIGHFIFLAKFTDAIMRKRQIVNRQQ